jgi:hypothetical protein
MGDLGKLKAACGSFVVILAEHEQKIGHLLLLSAIDVLRKLRDKPNYL